MAWPENGRKGEEGEGKVRGEGMGEEGKEGEAGRSAHLSLITTPFENPGYAPALITFNDN